MQAIFSLFAHSLMNSFFILQDKCGDPGQPEGGSVKRTPEHLEVIYSCNPGFIPEGEMRSVCTENGSWVPDPNNVVCHRYRPTASTGVLWRCKYHYMYVY